jgi:prepilin-type N-terminal cleavage/methylation domain-containing protein
MAIHTRSGGTLTRAFTLLEVLIAIVLISLMLAVAIPALGALSGAQLKETSGLIGGVIRDTYARTALVGKSARLVMDFDQNAWWIEQAPSVARTHRDKIKADRDDKAQLDPQDERLEHIEKDTTDEKELAELEILSPPAWKPVDGEDGQPHKLPGDVRFKDVWIEHLDDKMQKGQVALYFYPGGFTEEAFITLTDDDEGERTLTLVVSSLTGEVSIEQDEPRVPEVEDDAI